MPGWISTPRKRSIGEGGDEHRRRLPRTDQGRGRQSKSRGGRTCTAGQTRAARPGPAGGRGRRSVCTSPPAQVRGSRKCEEDLGLSWSAEGGAKGLPFLFFVLFYLISIFIFPTKSSNQMSFFKKS
jgi:hypothetical protein